MLIDVKKLLPDPLRLVILGEACKVSPDIPTDAGIRFQEAAETFIAASKTGEVKDPSIIYELLARIVEREPNTLLARLTKRRRFTVRELKRRMGLQTTVAIMTTITMWLNQTSADVARQAVENPLKAAVR